MPHSDATNKPWTIDRIVERQPKTVLDAGAGSGIYVRLLRNRLPNTRFTAVEVWEPYIEEWELRKIYDEVVIEDIRQREDFDYDVVIFGDVLEHMSRDDALVLWNKTLSQARYAVISIPIIHYEQGAIENNPYEIHVEEDWTTETVLEAFPGIVEYKEFPITGVFIASAEKYLQDTAK